jgi:hypothetical protein
LEEEEKEEERKIEASIQDQLEEAEDERLLEEAIEKSIQDQLEEERTTEESIRRLLEGAAATGAGKPERGV